MKTVVEFVKAYGHSKKPKKLANLTKRQQSQNNIIKKPKAKKTKIKDGYQIRKASLRKLGYKSYHEYLHSEEWKNIRKHQLEQFPHCLLCQNKADQIHHLAYNIETLLGNQPFNLFSICKNCHQSIEYEGNNKRSLYDANICLFILLEYTEAGLNWMETRKTQKMDFYELIEEIKQNKTNCQLDKLRKQYEYTKAAYLQARVNLMNYKIRNH